MTCYPLASAVCVIVGISVDISHRHCDVIAIEGIKLQGCIWCYERYVNPFVREEVAVPISVTCNNIIVFNPEAVCVFDYSFILFLKAFVVRVHTVSSENCCGKGLVLLLLETDFVFAKRCLL